MPSSHVRMPVPVTGISQPPAVPGVCPAGLCRPPDALLRMDVGHLSHKENEKGGREPSSNQKPLTEKARLAFLIALTRFID